MHPYRTHNCNELRKEHVGQEARLSGWVFRKRDHGSLLFLDLRDHYGLTQIVIQPDAPFFADCQRLHLESVMTVTGPVMARAPETVNPSLPTGEVELRAQSITTLSEAVPLPFSVNIEEDGNEELRLRYRYLDLRREKMHSNILLRTQVISAIRRRMTELGFNKLLPGRRAGLPRAQQGSPGPLLRPAPGAATVQTTAHGGRL